MDVCRVVHTQPSPGPCEGECAYLSLFIILLQRTLCSLSLSLQQNTIPTNRQKTYMLTEIHYACLYLISPDPE